MLSEPWLVLAYDGDRVTYHRLIKLQTGKVSQPIGELVIVGVSLVDQDDILDGWNRHFGALATPSTCQDYDRKYQQEASVDIYILDNLAKDSDHHIKQFSQDQVYKAMRQLNKLRLLTAMGLLSNICLTADTDCLISLPS